MGLVLLPECYFLDGGSFGGKQNRPGYRSLELASWLAGLLIRQGVWV
jgi:hypothetical protein